MTTPAEVLSGTAKWCVEQGDCFELLKTLPDSCIDSIVTDPPAGISFMQAAWDDDKGGRDEWIAWLQSVMVECMRVLKPGGHAIVWSLPRTSHWTATAIENAGFDVRDVVSHWFGSGFPKSTDLSKAADKVAGAVRPIVGEWKVPGRGKRSPQQKFGLTAEEGTITAPATAALQGWGSALKPSAEFWWMARKPFKGSLVRNVLEHGTGGINVDACRVGNEPRVNQPMGSPENAYGGYGASASASAVVGRWPSHVVLSHGASCEIVGTKKIKAAPAWNDNRPQSSFTGAETSPVHHSDEDGTETVEEWRCEEGCPVRILDEQSGDRPGFGGFAPGVERKASRGAGGYSGSFPTALTSGGHADSGGASRFFTTLPHDGFIYHPKGSTAEKEVGLDHRKRRKVTDGRAVPNDTPYLRDETKRANTHPTAKSIGLMRWLCRLVTPKGGVVLDPFCGSGSTGVACSQEQFRFIGFELSEEFAGIARDRITGDAPLLNAAGGSK